MKESLKKDYVDFMVETGALKFGSFPLGSGRRSPFLLDVGAYSTGPNLKKLGRFYAHAIVEHFGPDFDVLFGPAYKGIPIAAATAMEIYELYGRKVRYCSNRRDFEDGSVDSVIFGSELHRGDRIVLIEDVITSGESIEEAIEIIVSQADVEIVGLIVAFDRHEHRSSRSKIRIDPDEITKEHGLVPSEPEPTITALEGISKEYGFPAASIVAMRDVVRLMDKRLPYGKIKEIHEYYKHYGIDWQS